VLSVGNALAEGGGGADNANMTTSKVEIELTWRLRRDWQALPLLAKVAAGVARAEGFRRGNLSVAVVGARAMATLHQRFLKQAGPTDVITFDLGTDRRARVLDGEIVVCADVARRTAAAALRQHGKRCTMSAARAELALYVAHGVLHLAGYDDHDAGDFRRMHAREDQLLQRLGVGRVFAGQ